MPWDEFLMALTPPPGFMAESAGVKPGNTSLPQLRLVERLRRYVQRSFMGHNSSAAMTTDFAAADAAVAERLRVGGVKVPATAQWAGDASVVLRLLTLFHERLLR